MRALAMLGIKVLHSLIFFAMSAGVFYLLYSAFTGRITRWTWIVIVAIVGEGGVLLLFGGTCPLRLLAEELGEDSGSVTDIFLPRWLASRIFVIFTPLAILGISIIVLRTLLVRRSLRPLA